MSTTTTELVSYEGPRWVTELVAVGGFMAGRHRQHPYRLHHRPAHLHDWCRSSGVALLEV